MKFGNIINLLPAHAIRYGIITISTFFICLSMPITAYAKAGNGNMAMQPHLYYSLLFSSGFCLPNITEWVADLSEEDTSFNNRGASLELIPGVEDNITSVIDSNHCYIRSDNLLFCSPFDFNWSNKLSSPYGVRFHPILKEQRMHQGIDIAVPYHTPILAIHSGIVVAAGEGTNNGIYAAIEDDLGYISYYLHCSQLNVSTGQEIAQGDIVGYVGSTGLSTGNHLHLGIQNSEHEWLPIYTYTYKDVMTDFMLDKNPVIESHFPLDLNELRNDLVSYIPKEPLYDIYSQSSPDSTEQFSVPDDPDISDLTQLEFIRER